MWLTLAEVGQSVATTVDSAQNGKPASKDAVDGGGEDAIIFFLWDDDYQCGKGRKGCKWILRVTIERTG